VRQFHGVLSAVLRAYAWVMSLGNDGLREVSDVAILNNNYMMNRLLNEIRGISVPWSDVALERLEQVRYSFERLYKDTGISSEDINARMLDFGFQRFNTSHHPVVIPEPYTPEPTESYSKGDIDEYVDTLKYICGEAYSAPEIVKNAPYNGPISRFNDGEITNPDDLIVTWRAYKRKNNLYKREK
ncbi:MAG: glycine dehydrogenase subunit 2, partial [Clostridiaceae bacterium]|nr:glycine dehydrogenase subunit 2 [Clostridiaceae bacterium]